MSKCYYCTEDAEGWAVFLPREGKGITAAIHDIALKGPALVMRGPNKTRAEILIRFCPICGRDLRKENTKNEKRF
jgi:hypothetical protein